MTRRDPLLEICVDSPAGARAAQDGGADRVELCSDLREGGITPSAGAIRVARQLVDIPLMVIIRPRGGDFIYGAAEREAMLQDIDGVREAGADGVVLGALTSEGGIDRVLTAELVARARPLQVTFHRAFDHTSAPLSSLETLIDLGIDRVLTSGQESTAMAGLPLLRELVSSARDRIIILPGGGIREPDIGRVVRESGAREVHCSAFEERESPALHWNLRCPLSGRDLPSPPTLRVTTQERVRALALAVRCPR